MASLPALGSRAWGWESPPAALGAFPGRFSASSAVTCPMRADGGRRGGLARSQSPALPRHRELVE